MQSTHQKIIATAALAVCAVLFTAAGAFGGVQLPNQDAGVTGGVSASSPPPGWDGGEAECAAGLGNCGNNNRTTIPFQGGAGSAEHYQVDFDSAQTVQGIEYADGGTARTPPTPGETNSPIPSGGRGWLEAYNVQVLVGGSYVDATNQVFVKSGSVYKISFDPVSTTSVRYILDNIGNLWYLNKSSVVVDIVAAPSFAQLPNQSVGVLGAVTGSSAPPSWDGGEANCAACLGDCGNNNRTTIPFQGGSGSAEYVQIEFQDPLGVNGIEYADAGTIRTPPTPGETNSPIPDGGRGWLEAYDVQVDTGSGYAQASNIVFTKTGSVYHLGFDAVLVTGIRLVLQNSGNLWYMNGCSLKVDEAVVPTFEQLPNQSAGVLGAVTGSSSPPSWDGGEANCAACLGDCGNNNRTTIPFQGGSGSAEYVQIEFQDPLGVNGIEYADAGTIRTPPTPGETNSPIPDGGRGWLEAYDVQVDTGAGYVQASNIVFTKTGSVYHLGFDAVTVTGIRLVLQSSGNFWYLNKCSVVVSEAGCDCTAVITAICDAFADNPPASSQEMVAAVDAQIAAVCSSPPDDGTCRQTVLDLVLGGP